MNIPHIHFSIDIQKSTDNVGSYIVVNPSVDNWANVAYLAPTLCENNLLELLNCGPRFVEDVDHDEEGVTPKTVVKACREEEGHCSVGEGPPRAF
jgi:hypothetical protein